MSYRWLLLACLLLPLSAKAAVQATLDRNDVHLGETVTLNLRVDGSNDVQQPDLSALTADFEVLGTSTNSILADDNGHRTEQFIIGVALRPKHQGDVTIPAITLGNAQTAPLVLHVLPPDASAGGAVADARKNVDLQMEANTDHAYIGQQLLLTVRLFIAVNLNSGALPDPHADGATLSKLGGDTDYETERNGRRYHVVERRYALVPRQAGTVTIPSIEFQGESLDPVDPSNPAAFFNGGMFGNSSPVTADSNAITLDVKAAPADWGKTAWLPARSLSLKLDGFPTNDQVRVGEPLNLRMTLDAAGVGADVLPELSLPTVDGATVYPDPSSTSTQDDGQWITAHRARSFAVFPQHAGSLTVPATTLTWFDTQSGQKQVATIPAHTVTVLPAAGSAASAPASSASAPAAENSAPTNASNAAAGGNALWRWLALGSIGLWLLAVIAVACWSWGRRHRVVAIVDVATPSARAARQAFMTAAQSRDVAAQSRTLLAWARVERPALHNLGELAAALASEAQQSAIATLQRAQYAGVAEGAGADLSRTFAQGFVWRAMTPGNAPSDLPPLYPFKLD